MRKRIWASVILGIVTVTAVVFAIGSAAAGPVDNGGPPGNNGTVKIDAEAFDDHPDNEPHVGCTFQVDFYGFDEGDLFALVTFVSHPPTGPVIQLLQDTVFIGEDDNSGGGSEAGLDASVTYTLDFTGIAPHPIQGFHVKLTVNAEGSQGADTKQKVFWVTGCGPTTTTSPPTTTSTPPTTTTSAAPTTTSAAPTTTSAAPTTTSAAPTTPTDEPTTTTQGFQANVQGAGITGGEGVWLGLAALAILLAITFTIRMSSDRGRD